MKPFKNTKKNCKIKMVLTGIINQIMQRKDIQKPLIYIPVST